MNIVQINFSCGKGSTGKICVSISNLLNEKGINNFIFFSHGKTVSPNGVKFGNGLYFKVQALKGRIFGNNGFNDHFVTRELVKRLEKIHPDIVHLHNIHSNDINLEILFNYLKKSHIKVFWTFHDCWAFTGYCPHFSFLKCDKYISECNKCPYHKKSSWFFDKSGKIQKRKFKVIQGADLTIFTPSQWLAKCVKQSCLKDFPVKVINNGIDLDVFKPTVSDFREKHGLEYSFIVLGVAFDWSRRKGLDVFVELSKRLPDQYKIVLVGTNSAIDKLLPKNIISIHRTANQEELAEIYSAANIFVNPTREDTYPTVNMEALACGTPVITFKTGGSPEIIDNTSGLVVECDDIDSLEKGIINCCLHKTFSLENCLIKAECFNEKEKFKEYIREYERTSK